MTGTKVHIQAALSTVGLVSLVALLLLDVALVVDATPTPLPTKPAPLTNQPASMTSVPETKVPPPPLPPTMKPTNSTPRPTTPPPSPVPTADCEDSYSCATCVEKSSCGWVDGYSCAEGNSNGPKFGPSPSSWHYNSCPTSFPPIHVDSPPNYRLWLIVSFSIGLVLASVKLLMKFVGNRAEAAVPLQEGTASTLNPATDGAATVPMPKDGALPPGEADVASPSACTNGYGTLNSS